MKRQNIYDNHYEPVDELDDDMVIDLLDDGQWTVDCICRNRQRFTSLDCEIIDNATRYVLESMRLGESKRLAVGRIEQLGLSKQQASCIYTSTLLYMRTKHYANARVSINKPDEFSLGADLKLIVGAREYVKLAAIFGGINLKL